MVKELQGVTAPPVHWAHIYVCRYVEGLMAAFDAVSQSGSHRIHIGHTGTSLSQTRTVVETAVAIVFPLYSCWAHWRLPILDTNRCAHSAIPIGHTDTSLLSTQTVQDYIWRISQGEIRVWRDRYHLATGCVGRHLADRVWPAHEHGPEERPAGIAACRGGGGARGVVAG